MVLQILQVLVTLLIEELPHFQVHRVDLIKTLQLVIVNESHYLILLHNILQLQIVFLELTVLHPLSNRFYLHGCLHHFLAPATVNQSNRSLDVRVQ